MSSSPHDALFKAVFGQAEHARSALRTMMPASVAEALDWASLAPCAGSFIDPVLSERHTDLLFSVAWRTGGEALVYLLFEHQSTADPRMAFRLLRYLVRIWERWLADHPRAEQLPVVVPVVLYHGAEAWSAPVAFDDLFDLPDAVRPSLAPHLVRFRFVLDDLSDIPDEQLRGRAMTALGRLVEVCFKYARSHTSPLEFLSQWAKVLQEVMAAHDGMEALTLVMRYILLVNDHVEQPELQAFLARVGGPGAKDIVMTAGQRLIQEGVQQGVQQGQRELLLELVRTRFGQQVDAAMEQRMATASREQISVWAKRVVSAVTLGELLAD